MPATYWLHDKIHQLQLIYVYIASTAKNSVKYHCIVGNVGKTIITMTGNGLNPTYKSRDD